MGKLASLALSLLTGSLWRWPLALLRWITATPARAWAAIAILALAGTGLEYRLVRNYGAISHAAIAQLKAEQSQAKAIKALAELKYRILAHDAGQNYAALQAQGDARLAAYIADHRVRIAAPTHSASAAQGGNPAILANAAPDQLVATLTISEADLRVCDANYAYARAAFDWAQRIGE
ncbi:hypothetical protein FHW96_002346 [Novosphingobium sp. SG751A]|uniref:hypothetical protein n=1 Tax=Novosphingobium sp. SG751A TaxID=2587000 RepID=UPI001555A621|nr:hypothetical protein [Novosphingobium sp. SG751A]NOW46188.1 hypothetical protein [Novosphingobium sp. SG751A]